MTATIETGKTSHLIANGRKHKVLSGRPNDRQLGEVLDVVTATDGTRYGTGIYVNGSGHAFWIAWPA